MTKKNMEEFSISTSLGSNFIRLNKPIAIVDCHGVTNFSSLDGFMNHYQRLGLSEFIFFTDSTDGEVQDTLHRRLGDQGISILIIDDKDQKNKWTQISKYLLSKDIGPWVVAINYEEYYYYGMQEVMNIQAFVDYLDHYGYDGVFATEVEFCLLYTSPSPRDRG